MLRREPLDGHDTILATLTPRRDVKPQTDDGKIMRHFAARAWINEADAELVRVEITAIDTLTIGLGLLARIDKGTVASYQRRWVNGEALAAGTGHVDRGSARAAVEAAARARHRRVLGLPQVHRRYRDDHRGAEVEDRGEHGLGLRATGYGLWAMGRDRCWFGLLK